MRKKLLITALCLSASLAAAQTKPSLVYLGPVGTYSDAVAQTVAAQRGLIPVLASSITDVSNQVSLGKAPFGLIPVQNSSGSYVAETLGLLGKTPAWRVIGFADLAIDNTLLVLPGTRKEDIKTIISHPQPFLQSDAYLKANYPGVRRVEVKSTAAAAEQVAKDGDRSQAAIAAPGAAQVYGLDVLASRIQDDKNNTTRFMIVQAAALPNSGTVDRAIVSYLPPVGDRGQHLGVLLAALRNTGMNVTGVASSPTGLLARERLTIFLQSSRPVSLEKVQQATLTHGGETTLLGAFTTQESRMSDSDLSSTCPRLQSQSRGALRLAQLSACRLDIARDVAQAKFNSGAAIEDKAREKVVVDSGVAALQGVDAKFVSDYWTAQIEASKAVQNALISSWKASGQEKFNPAPDLIKDVRPKLDTLAVEISRVLADVWSQRECQVAPAATDSFLPNLMDKTTYLATLAQALAPIAEACH